MFSAGVWGTIEDAYLGGRNAISDLFAKSNGEVLVAGIRMKYGDFLADVDGLSMEDKVDMLMETMADRDSKLYKSIEYSRKRTNVSDEMFNKVLLGVFTERFTKSEKKAFLKYYNKDVAQSQDKQPEIDTDVLGKVKMSDKLTKLIADVSDGTITKDEAIEKLAGIDTKISFDIKDLLDISPVCKDDKEETRDLKSLLMDTEIGQKLFEHV